jgi:hypothetical protein
MPIYCLLFLRKNSSSVPGAIPSNKAKMVLPAAVLGFLLPSIIMACRSRLTSSESTQQLIIALWQPFPVYVGALQKLLALTVKQKANLQADIASSKMHVKHTYQFAALCCGGSHIYTVSRILAADNPLPMFKRVFFLDSNIARTDISNLAHNFFLSDFLLCFTAVTLLMTLLIRPKQISLFRAIWCWILLGPGALLMWVQWKRESEVSSQSMQSKRK